MSDLEQRVHDAVAEIPGVTTLLVFGSRARGDERPDSDLDVAILANAEHDPDKEGAQSRRLQLQKRLLVALAHLAPEGRVDVVFLDEAPVTLRQRVMEQGRMILCRDEETWKALRVQTMREYGDSIWFRRIYRRALKRRLQERRPSDRSARTREPLGRARRVSDEAREL